MNFLFPVKDRLVEKATQWPGVNGYRNLLHRQPLKARRPRHFFRTAGVMPEAVTLELTIPPELGSADERRASAQVTPALRR